MTFNEVFSTITYSIVVTVDGVVVHSRGLHYLNPDGTDSPEDINTHQYTAAVQAAGKTINITAEGNYADPTGQGVFYRNVTISSTAPFLMASIARLNEVVTWDGTSTGYGIASWQNELFYRRAKGANTASYDATADAAQLWTQCRVPNKYNFGGMVIVNLHFCTHLPLRDRETGQLLRDITTGKILRDD